MEKSLKFLEKSCVFLRSFAGLFRLFTVLYRYDKQKGKHPEGEHKMPIKITKTTEKELLKIAKIYSATIRERGDLEERNSDSEDFIDISVWGLKKMLEQAYALGAKREAK